MIIFRVAVAKWHLGILGEDQVNKMTLPFHWWADGILHSLKVFLNLYLSCQR